MLSFCIQTFKSDISQGRTCFLFAFGGTGSLYFLYLFLFVFFRGRLAWSQIETLFWKNLEMQEISTP